MTPVKPEELNVGDFIAGMFGGGSSLPSFDGFFEITSLNRETNEFTGNTIYLKKDGPKVVGTQTLKITFPVTKVDLQYINSLYDTK